MSIRKMQVGIVIMILGMLTALSGCNLGGDEPDYMIKFTIDGTEYVFTKAFEDPADVAEGGVSPSGSKTLLVADNSVDGIYVYISFNGTDTGTYHDVADSTFFEYVNPGNNLLDNHTTAGDFDLTVTEYGPVGGILSGTFSGQVMESGTANTYPLTDGYFCVKRKADASIVMK